MQAVKALRDATLDALKLAAKQACAAAYAPYSRYPVGAALLCEDGRTFSACNVENASYGLCICAERAAMFQAIAHGARTLTAIAIYTPTRAAATPCGACRQVLSEFAHDATVICCCDDAAAERRFELSALLPSPFGPECL